MVVRPGPPLTGRFAPPGDKSITHRACLLGALADGVTRVRNANPGADARATLAAVQMLGARVDVTGETLAITGAGGALAEPADVIDCGNSGTALRMLAGVLAPHPLLAVLTGDASLRARPMARVIEPLTAMGATLVARGGNRLPPLVVRGARLTGIRWRLEVASAQVASCVLLAGLGAAGETVVELPGPARDHTERMLPAFGIEVARADGDGAHRLAVRGPVVPRATGLTVPGDFSAAAFFLAAAAAAPGASVTATGVGLNPTRTGLLQVLEAMGARVETTVRGHEANEPVGDVTVTGPARLRAFDVPAAWLPRLVDEVPAWAVAAAAADGVSRVQGAAELRVKESDRLAALAQGLAALGIEVGEAPDGLAIRGGPVAGGRVRAHDDHRIAMAFAVLATRAGGEVSIDDARGIGTSYPSFGEQFRALGGATDGIPGELPSR
ncbi:MAG TPA: 3-phosphoshikimate 1-carboxyvinyltransferase [Candidatus Eisenbacteria bacterium]|nr:3-phosphoshikimate 1-carboxyvinyltransferase [Candidatus Eisenbacteria bacterium]